MANLEKQFNEYINKVYISNKSFQSDQLRKSRDNAREKIIQYFKENQLKAPNFKMQGSFEMNTIITPLSGEYDLDDGVYLNNLEGNVDEWKNPDTVHGWIRDAVSGITKEPPSNKKSCIRLRYRDDYHIDFPIYAMSDNTQYYAVSGQAWKENENYPQEYYEWFNNKVKNNPQIREIVILIKAWKDFQQYSNDSIKLPSGIVLTTLGCEHYVKDDDIQHSFFHTLENIYNKLQGNFSIKRPVKPYNDFLHEYPSNRKNRFLEILKSIVEDSGNVINQQDAVKASEQWQKYLGDRFPLAEKPESSNYSATIGNQRSA